MAKKHEKEQQLQPVRVFGWLAFYFSLHIILRVVSSPALELDEAEQIVLSQWLLPSYLAQPPLYTWLQIAFIDIFGINVFSLSILKNALLFLTYIFIFLSVRRITGSNILATLASISLIFIPQISWAAQKDLTHSVLLLTTSSAFFYIMVILSEAKNLMNYALLGLTIGLGLLSKHNFTLFFGAFIIACLISSETRNLLIDCRVFLSILIAFFVILPYAHSIISDPEGFINVIHEQKSESLTSSIKVLGELTYRIPLIFLPLSVVYAIAFPREFIAGSTETSSTKYVNLIRRHMMILILLLALSILLFGITKIKNRWIAPLMILIPTYLIIRSGTKTFSTKKVSLFLKIAVATGVIILMTMCIRNFSCSISGMVTDFNYPSETIADEIRALGFREGIIITDNRISAGSLKMQFKDSTVLCPEIKGLRINPLGDNTCEILVLWDASEQEPIPKDLRQYLVKDLGISGCYSGPIYRNVPLHLCKNKTVRVGILFWQHDRDSLCANSVTYPADAVLNLGKSTL